MVNNRNIKQIIQKLILTPYIEREFAFVVDLAIVFIAQVFGGYFVAIGIIYFLQRDVSGLSFKGLSFGKDIYGLVVVNTDQTGKASATALRILLRNILILVPVLNLYDLYVFCKTGKRYIDGLLKLDVVFVPEATADSKTRQKSSKGKEDSFVENDELVGDE